MAMARKQTPIPSMVTIFVLLAAVAALAYYLLK
jgi:hypothetical protein